MEQQDLFHAAHERYAATLAQRRQQEDRPEPAPAPERALHQHSLDAHAATEETMTGRKRAIMEWLRAYGPATDRQVKDAVIGERFAELLQRLGAEVITVGRSDTFVPVDTEAAPQTAGRLQIRSIPTLALFRGGREVARQAGALSAADIVAWVQAHGA